MPPPALCKRNIKSQEVAIQYNDDMSLQWEMGDYPWALKAEILIFQ